MSPKHKRYRQGIMGKGLNNNGGKVFDLLIFILNHCVCLFTGKDCMFLTSTTMQQDCSLESPWQLGEWGGRVGRLVRTHADISIDLDETSWRGWFTHSLKKENKTTEWWEIISTARRTFFKENRAMTFSNSHFKSQLCNWRPDCERAC